MLDKNARRQQFERVTPGQARKAIVEAANAGAVVFRYHAAGPGQRMTQRRITTDEVLFALANVAQLDDQRDGTWKVRGPGLAGGRGLTVVVAIEAGVVVVTVWRNSR